MRGSTGYDYLRYAPPPRASVVEFRAICEGLLASHPNGFSCDLNGKLYQPLRGYAVSVTKEPFPTFDGAREWAYQHTSLAQPLFLGAWVEQDKLYIDVNELVFDSAEARCKGIERNQRTIYDFAKKIVIPLFLEPQD